MDRRQLLGALALAGTAGCLRLASNSEDETPTNSPTEQPSDPVEGDETPTKASTSSTTTSDETESPTGADPDEYPTGITEQGVDPVLAGAHASELLSTSYTVQSNLENISEARTFEDVSIQSKQRNALLEAPLSKELQLLFDGDRRWWQANHNSETVYGTNTLGVSVNAITRRRKLSVMIEAGDFGPPEFEREDGERRFRSDAEEIANPEPLLELFSRKDVRSVESFEGTIVVDESSIIHKLSVETELFWNDQLNLVQYEYTTGDIGSTAAPKPEWLGTAENQAARVSTDLTNDNRVVRVTNDGPGKVPAGARAILHPEGSYMSSDRGLLDSELAADERLWLWREDGETQVERSPPDQGAPESLDGRFITSLDIGVANYMRRSIE